MSRESFYNDEDNSFQHREPNNSNDSANITNLESLIQQYGNNMELLELILRSKVEEDRRRTEEAKLKNKELDLMIQTKLNGSMIDKDITPCSQKSNQSLFLNSTIMDRYGSSKFDIESAVTTTTTTTNTFKPTNIQYQPLYSSSSSSSPPSYKRVSLPSINTFDTSHIPFHSNPGLDNLNISLSPSPDQSTIYQKANINNLSNSTYNTFNGLNQPILNNIERQNHIRQREKYLQSNKINNNNSNNSNDNTNNNNNKMNHFKNHNNDINKMNIPTSSTSTTILKTKGSIKEISLPASSSSLSSTKKLLLPQKQLNDQKNNKTAPIMKRKRREMQPITMIIETKEFPYNDNYQWKNNGNTIHRKSGQKSIYYKCSNSTKNCPVNKTVVFKDNGEYLIKYRGEHLPDCRMIENVRDL